MKLVKENISNFERELPPLSSMGIGISESIRKSIIDIFIKYDDYILEGTPGTIKAISIFTLIFSIKYYQEMLQESKNRKSYAIEVIEKAGLSEYFNLDKIDYDYKIRTIIYFRIKDKYKNLFKSIRGIYEAGDYVER